MCGGVAERIAVSIVDCGMNALPPCFRCSICSSHDKTQNHYFVGILPTNSFSLPWMKLSFISSTRQYDQVLPDHFWHVKEDGKSTNDGPGVQQSSTWQGQKDLWVVDPCSGSNSPLTPDLQSVHAKVIRKVDLPYLEINNYVVSWR